MYTSILTTVELLCMFLWRKVHFGYWIESIVLIKYRKNRFREKNNVNRLYEIVAYRLRKPNTFFQTCEYK